MPYKDPEKQRAYAREWMRSRRQEWIAKNGPCKSCGATEHLEVDHIDPTSKLHHSVWSWRKERRERELEKCQVLCSSCHKKKTAAQLTKPMVHGTLNAYKRKFCRCAECRAAKAKAQAEYRRFGSYHEQMPSLRTLVDNGVL